MQQKLRDFVVILMAESKIYGHEQFIKLLKWVSKPLKFASNIFKTSFSTYFGTIAYILSQLLFPGKLKSTPTKMAHLMNHDRGFLKKMIQAVMEVRFLFAQNVTDDGNQMFHFHMFGPNALFKNFPVDEDKLWNLLSIDPEIFYI